MPKKSFKQVTNDNPALAFLGTQTPVVQAVQHKDDVQPVQRKDDVHDVQRKDDVQPVQRKDDVQDVQRKDDVHDVQRKDDVQPVHIADKTTKYCNINLRLRQDLKDYLSDASWQTRTTMTQYISNLIESDMKTKQERADEKNV